MADNDKVNILLVDDQPAKLLAYEVILKDLNENLVMVSSGQAALEYLLKNEIAVVLIDVCMPELDGFELASMIRAHPRFVELHAQIWSVLRDEVLPPKPEATPMPANLGAHLVEE